MRVVADAWWSLQELSSEGFVALSALLGLFVWGVLAIRRRDRRRQRLQLARTTLDAATAGALALIALLTLLPTQGLGVSTLSQIEAGNTAYLPLNLVPFDTIRLYLEYGSEAQVVRNLGNNVLLFVPLGYALALRYRNRRHPLVLTVLTGAFVSMLVEAGQFVLPIIRSTDVDDVILNAAGALLGGVIAAGSLPALRRVARGSRASGHTPRRDHATA